MAIADPKIRPRFKDQYERDIKPMMFERFGYD